MVREINLNEVEALRRVRDGVSGARFWVSWLETQGYCEYKLCLVCVGKVPSDSEATLEGVRIHAEKDAAYPKAAGSVDLVALDLMVKGTGEVYRLRDVSLQSRLLSGRIDEVAMYPYVVYTIDDKTRSRTGHPFYSQIRQALGYALLWKQSYPRYKGIVVAAIADKYKGETLWQQALDKAAEADVLGTLERIRRILRDPDQAEETPKKATKCLSCRWGQEHLCDRYERWSLGL